MNRHAVQLITRGAINRMGNMLYDYGNSVWLASMGTIGKTVLGIYQISELVTSILVNPFGGVISDRFSRRKILMTTDLVCGLLCLGISFWWRDLRPFFTSQDFDDNRLGLWSPLFGNFFYHK